MFMNNKRTLEAKRHLNTANRGTRSCANVHMATCHAALVGRSEPARSHFLSHVQRHRHPFADYHLDDAIRKSKKGRVLSKTPDRNHVEGNLDSTVLYHGLELLLECLDAKGVAFRRFIARPHRPEDALDRNCGVLCISDGVAFGVDHGRGRCDGVLVVQKFSFPFPLVSPYTQMVELAPSNSTFSVHADSCV